MPGGQVAVPEGEAGRHEGPRRGSLSGREAGLLALPVAGECLRTPETTATRQAAFFTGKTAERLDSHTARMQRRIDEPAERARYARRFATVEPVFGNLCANKRLDRFTLRGRQKMDRQWKPYCLVQNIEKLAHLRYAA